METALQIKNICKRYDKLLANNNINLSVKKGSIHAIIGENGAGKSTLMNIISGVVTPTSGELLLSGERVAFNGAHDATVAGIGMVQQEFMLFDDLTVLENIIIGYEDTKGKYFLNKEDSIAKIEKICEEYGFKFDLNKKIQSLPVVLQQQVEIVKVLFKNADIIILDEPTAVLPPQEVEGLFKAIRFLQEQGKTILFITHKLKEILEISDTITVMRNGEIVDTIDVEGATEEILTKMMVGRDVMLKVEKQPPERKETVLSVENLSVFDERKIKRVKNVSFDVKAGEIVGIVGVSGNGQNELVESIAGMRIYQEGKIKISGKDLPMHSPLDNRLNGIGYVPQDRQKVGSSVVSNLIENSIMGSFIKRFKKNGFLLDYKEGEEYTREIAKKFKVKHQSIYDEADSLSGGNLQKLIVGREFTQGNKLLIIEDPTRGIDVGSIEFIWNEIIKQVEDENVSVLLITYDLNEAMTLSDRVLVLFDGEILKEIEGPDYDEQEIGLYMLGGEKDA